MFEVNCARCQIRACYAGKADLDSLPNSCPTRTMPHVAEKALEQYHVRILFQATIQQWHFPTVTCGEG